MSVVLIYDKTLVFLANLKDNSCLLHCGSHFCSFVHNIYVLHELNAGIQEHGDIVMKSNLATNMSYIHEFTFTVRLSFISLLLHIEMMAKATEIRPSLSFNRAPQQHIMKSSSSNSVSICMKYQQHKNAI